MQPTLVILQCGQEQSLSCAHRQNSRWSHATFQLCLACGFPGEDAFRMHPTWSLCINLQWAVCASFALCVLDRVDTVPWLLCGHTVPSAPCGPSALGDFKQEARSCWVFKCLRGRSVSGFFALCPHFKDIFQIIAAAVVQVFQLLERAQHSGGRQRPET
mmetsp:Transcript_57992/g.154518  ORF Transcript_57992/g.154518 Transcript_57992/m.154518 type:complete len:159 (-) Transcript_57992:24-500(-)